MSRLCDIRHWLWRHLSLLVIVASWVANVLWPWSPHTPSAGTLRHVFALVLVTTTSTWILLWLLVRHDGETLSALGLATGQLKRSLLPGALFGLGIFGVCNFIVPFLTRKWLSDSHALPIANWFRSLAAIPIWMFLGWIAGGLTEEARRVFVLTRFERTFGRAGLVSAVVISSAIFGLGHLYQGQAAAFSLGVSGALYALVYLRRRSCWEAVIAHATFDTLGIAVLFYLNLGQGG